MSTSTIVTITTGFWTSISNYLAALLPVLLPVVAGFILLFMGIHWVYGKSRVR